MASITLTKEGHDELRGAKRPDPLPVTNYNNYGQAGAMGPHSTGVLNVHSDWAELQRDTDLQRLTIVIQNAITDKRQSATTSEDYQHLALLTQARDHAEKQEGSKLLAILAQMGKSALPVLSSAGAKGLVWWLEKKIGISLP